MGALDVLRRNPADGDPVVSDLELASVDGQVWFDRIGRMADCVPAVAARPSTPGDEDVIVDDALPAGATLASGANAPLVWTAGQAASSSLALVHPYRGQATSVTACSSRGGRLELFDETRRGVPSAPAMSPTSAKSLLQTSMGH